MSPIADHVQFLNVLEQKLDASATAARPLGLCLIWLDCLYHIDGMLGYRAGDAAFANIQRQLRGILKEEDQIFRVGRHEVACILPTITGEVQAVLAGHKIVRILGGQIALDPYSVQSEPHVGVALYPTHGDSADSLLRKASRTLREAREHKLPVLVYDEDADQAAQSLFRLQTDLRQALTNNALTMHHQAQVDLRSGRITGMEALCRWISPTHGSISPAEFIPVAEAAGMIHDITAHALNTALREFRELDAYSQLCISINLSAHDLLRAETPPLIEQALKTWGVAPERVVIEITETAIMNDQQGRVVALEKIKDLGVKLAIDDFGTGYSSLARLRQLPVDELKIDISFVRHLLRDKRDENMVRYIIELAHNIGLRVVAEGVEDEATMLRLSELGCDLMQGNFFSPPLPLDDFRTLLANLV